MAKNITIKEGTVARNFTGVKKLQTNVIGGGNQLWIPEDEAADYCTFKKITLRQNGTVKAEDNACDGFSEVTVDIPMTLKEKVVTANGEYLASQDNCAGYSKVTVNVSGGGSGSGRHTVIFYAYDRTTILEKQLVDDGGGAIYHGATPTSPGMRFVGWSPNPINVRADMNVYPRFENLIYDPTQILDDWVTIAQNVRTNPDAYNIGQWKLLELNALPLAEYNSLTSAVAYGSDFENGIPSLRLRMRLVAKGVDALEGQNGYAPTTWVAMDAIPGLNGYFRQYNSDYGYSFSWDRSALRAFLQDQFTSKMFPQELLNYVRRIIKYTCRRDENTGGIETKSYPTIDWFFVPSLREVVGGCSDIASISESYIGNVADAMETTGVIYDIFCNGTYDATKTDRMSVIYGTDRGVSVSLRTSAPTPIFNNKNASCTLNGSDGRVTAGTAGADRHLISFCL